LIARQRYIAKGNLCLLCFAVLYLCLDLLLQQVICEEYFSQCYNDIDICLWTDGSRLNRHEAQSACQQRNSSFLPRITNIYIQSKLANFRFAARDILLENYFWIDVRASGINFFHWIDSSSFAGLVFVLKLYKY